MWYWHMIPTRTGGLTIEAGDESAIISWLGAHEHVDRDDGYGERLWTSVVVDVAAAALRGDFVVEDHFRGSHWVKQRIVDMSDPDRPQVISGMGIVLWSWVPVAGLETEWNEADSTSAWWGSRRSAELPRCVRRGWALCAWPGGNAGGAARSHDDQNAEISEHCSWGVSAGDYDDMARLFAEDIEFDTSSSATVAQP